MALSPRQLAGQRVIYGYKGLTPPDELLNLISHGEAAGVIFFSDNISSSVQLRAVVAEINRANASPDNPVRAPLLLMVDQEGGRIRRLDGPPLLSEKQIGSSASPAAEAARAGTQAARNLAAIGLNVNLAPVLDVYREAGDFDDQLSRSYGTNPELVARLGSAFITAHQRQGVAATAKHYPGLGSARASQNTDLSPVTLRLPFSSLTRVDEVPFRAAIDAKTDLIMVSWAVYPALDPARPAGFSSAIVENRLRHELGFKGVVISDGIEANALDAYGGIGERAQRAAAAGEDLLICAKLHSEPSVGESALNALEAGYLDGTLSKPAFETSARRVVALRRRLRR